MIRQRRHNKPCVVSVFFLVSTLGGLLFPPHATAILWIEGYPSTASVAQGDTVRLHIRTWNQYMVQIENAFAPDVALYVSPPLEGLWWSTPDSAYANGCGSSETPAANIACVSGNTNYWAVRLEDHGRRLVIATKTTNLTLFMSWDGGRWSRICGEPIRSSDPRRPC